MSEFLKKTINDYDTKDILDGNENILIDDNGVYKKTSIKNTSTFDNQIILKNGGLTVDDINKFVVCYTDNEHLKEFIDNGGNFDDFTGPLNEVRLPELESFTGQTGIFNIKINTQYIDLYDQNSQILFASIDVYDNDEWLYDSFDMRLRNFNFRLDDPFFEDLINTDNFNYEVFDTDIFRPSDDFSYVLMLNYYFLNGFPSSGYNGTSNLTSFVGEIFRSYVQTSIVDDILEIKVPTNVSFYYFQGNDRYLSEEDIFVKFIEDITIQRLIGVLGPKLRRKIIGVLTEIYDNGTVKVISLPDTYETIPFNSFDPDYIVNLNIYTSDDNQQRWSEGYVPFVGGLMYNLGYVTSEYGYYSNDELLLSTVQRYIPITTNKITNPIIFIKDDYGDD
jgi:hypothetical protein